MHNPEQSPHQLLNSAPIQNAFEAARYLFARELSDYRRYHYASTLRFLRFLEHFGRSVSALQALQSPPADLVTGLLPHAEVINEAARERLVCWQIVEGESCWYVEPESFAAFDWKIPGERAGLPEQWPYDYAQQPFHWQKKGIMCRDGFKEMTGSRSGTGSGWALPAETENRQGRSSRTVCSAPVHPPIQPRTAESAARRCR